MPSLPPESRAFRGQSDRQVQSACPARTPQSAFYLSKEAFAALCAKAGEGGERPFAVPCANGQNGAVSERSSGTPGGKLPLSVWATRQNLPGPLAAPKRLFVNSAATCRSPPEFTMFSLRLPRRLPPGVDLGDIPPFSCLCTPRYYAPRNPVEP
ncbi:hypothetical protein SDC9_30645 [bioreactor metagenome]|uniref:Uncharacterized protein n=1 Tax=bioreactor metagenome TaxID=1076179 RepID=A0A644V018_9ZZZZ